MGQSAGEGEGESKENIITLSFTLFIDAIRKEVNTVHSLIIQINNGMCPRTKRLLTRITRDRTNELYDRFNNNAIIMKELLKELSFLCQMINAIKI
jgi:hypothetical protein